MVFTHSGRLGDFFATLPIYSAWYKKYNEAVTIVVPHNFPFPNETKEFISQFKFIKDFIVSEFSVWHFDCGGVPYQFNPNDYGIVCEKWFNIGYRTSPNKYVASFCAEEYELEWDSDFTIDVNFDIDLHEKYKNTIGFADASSHRDDFGILNDIIKSTGVEYHSFDTKLSITENLKIARHCKYNIMAGSAMSVLMGFAKIPFAVYTWQTPPVIYYNETAEIFCVWQTPEYIKKQTPNKILSLLNLQDKL